MKITFIVSKLNFEASGGSTYELDIKIRALQERGHRVTAVTLYSQNNKLKQTPYQVVEENLKSQGLKDIQKGVARVIKKYEADTDLFHTEGQFGYGSGWYRGHGGTKPVSVHFNRELSSFPESTRGNGETLKKKLRFWFEKKFLFPIMNKNDQFTFTSPVLQDLYVSFGLKKEKTSVVSDFFDSSNIVNREKTPEQKFVSPEKPFTILCGGRLIPEKGFDVVLKAIAELKNNGIYKLIITGDGEEKSKLVKLAEELNISDLVEFKGWVEKQEHEKLFRQAHLFVVPRWRPELTSMLVLESMAFGLPMVVTGGTALDWQAGEAALNFKDEDSSDLASQIDKLGTNPQLCLKIANLGRERIKMLDYKQILPILESSLLNLKNGV